MVSVQSFTPDRQTRYGFSLKEQTPTQEIPTTNDWDLERYAMAFACVEYRCSEKNKDTFLVVNLLTDACVFPRPISPLRLKKNEYENFTLASRRRARFYAPFDVSDGKLGLYTGPGKLAEERCKAGGEMAVGGGTKKTTSAGYAVEAFYMVWCAPDEFPDWWWDDQQGGIWDEQEVGVSPN